LSEQVVDNVIKIIPMRKFGNSDLVAKSVLFLATDEAEYITGQVLSINGGYYM